ncbi:MAG TPA: ethanolamine ammonia-lyase subunit EutC, partial [Lichenihabitans sp.]|nr:ethanolamine ammonia-lyase subunit EutC [Lichenihabitans sp.]
ELGLVTIEVESAAPDRETYLRRPDFGRRLSARSRDLLAGHAAQPRDVVLVVADGLSATAVNRHAAALVTDLLPRLRTLGLRVDTACVARQGRVALGDDIGALLKARFCVMLIGERPGLSASDSLGAYLTYHPGPGRSDAERNCVSNIRPGGLSPSRAAGKIAWLVERAFALSLSGIALKDDSDHALPPPATRRIGDT